MSWRLLETLNKIAGLGACVGCVNRLNSLVCVIGKAPGGAAKKRLAALPALKMQVFAGFGV